LGIWNNRSYFCDALRPASPLPTLEGEAADYCPIGPGPFAFSVQIPLSNSHELTTLSTRLRAVDPSTAEILCVDVYTTPLKPGVYGETYGHAIIIFWASVALAIAYWLVVGIARIVGAWDRGTGHPGAGIWSRVESGGYVLASALSGERFAVSPALMRFCRSGCILRSVLDLELLQALPLCVISFFIRNGVLPLPWLPCSGLVSSVSDVTH
jgi:hypothetical protein